MSIYTGPPYPRWISWIKEHFRTTSDGQRYWLKDGSWKRYRDDDLPKINAWLNESRIPWLTSPPLHDTLTP